MRFFLLFLVCVAFAAHGRAGSTGDMLIDVQRLSDRVIVLSRLNTNVTAIATPNGIVIIDTHRSPTLMRSMADIIKDEFGRDDFAYVINTHGHWDHCSGNQVFAGATIIGHEYCPEAIRQYPPDSDRQERAHDRRLARLEEKLVKQEQGSPEAQRAAADIRAQKMIVGDLDGTYVPTPPTMTFENRKRIDLGDATLELIHCGAAHSIHDIFVFVPQENILMTGDVFCGPTSFCFSINAMTDVTRLLTCMDEILGADEELTIIPGHGDFMARDDLASLRDRLAEKYSEIQPAKSAAKKLRDLIDSIGIDPALAELDGAAEGLEFLEGEWHVLGRRLLVRGMVDEAIKVIEFSLKKLPQSALLHDVLGEAFLKKGDEAAAIEHYERSLEIEPRNRNASELLQMLRESN
jgi:glyoxylase-like metal-dependent hydrolase (beta-lactamase superfamily II)